MKYFDAVIFTLFLLFSLFSSLYLLVGSKNRKTTLMGIATLIFTVGAFFPLVQHMLYGFDYEIKFITASSNQVFYASLTIFFFLMYHILFAKKEEISKHSTSAICIYIFSIISMILVFFPLNKYFGSEGKVAPCIVNLIRSAPLLFTVLFLFFIYIKHRNDGRFNVTSLFILLAFASYTLVGCKTAFSQLDYFIYLEFISFALIIINFIRNKNYKIEYKAPVKYHIIGDVLEDY